MRNGQFLFLVAVALLLDFVIDAVVEQVHINHPVNQRLFLAHGIFHGSDLGRARRDIENADLVVLQVHFLLDFAADIHGCNVNGSPQRDEVLSEAGEFHLNQAHDGGTEGRNQRFDVGIFGGVFLFGRRVNRYGRFRLDDVCKSQLLEYAVDARHGNVVRELAHEDRRHQSHADGEVEDGLEIVLLDNDGAGGAHLEAIAAVDTTVGNQNGLAVAHAQCLSGANLHAARTAYAGVLVDFQGVEKRNLVHIVELLVVESLICCSVGANQRVRPIKH